MREFDEFQDAIELDFNAKNLVRFFKIKTSFDISSSAVKRRARFCFFSTTLLAPSPPKKKTHFVFKGNYEKVYGYHDPIKRLVKQAVLRKLRRQRVGNPPCTQVIQVAYRYILLADSTYQ